ncbi:uncharacterized protein LOC115210936 [Argonauta hians]
MAAGGNNLDELQSQQLGAVDGVYEENISLENLMQSSLSDNNQTAKKLVSFNDFDEDIDSEVYTENGSSNADSDSMSSDKCYSDNDSITTESMYSDNSNEAKPKMETIRASFKKINVNVSSMAKKIRSPVERLKNSQKNTVKKSTKMSTLTNLKNIKIDKLPQLFVAKYLGKRKCSKIVGSSVTRRIVDNMMKTILDNLDPKGDIELPLKYIVISSKGLHYREHPMNVVKGIDDLMDSSIESISYCVQDIKYWRVFTYILVKELSSKKHVAECHAFLCDSPVSARKMVLSLGAAFKIQMHKLRAEGTDQNRFCVELRTPEELKSCIDDDCEA